MTGRDRSPSGPLLAGETAVSAKPPYPRRHPVLNPALVRGLCAAGLLLAAASGARAGSNLVFNGSFNSTNDPLAGWKTDYRENDNAFYADNHTFVSVAEEAGGRRTVLDIHANQKKLDNEGVMVDSDPIPFDPAGRYKLTVWNYSTGPNCRVLVELYQWKPGVKPHPNPTLAELRKCYKCVPVYFGDNQSGNLSHAQPRWTKGETYFPPEKPTELAKDKLEKAKFAIVHIYAEQVIGGDAYNGHLYVDDVNLERLK